MATDQPKQKTPKGYEMPIPKRKDFEEAIRKAANPKSKDSTTSRPVK